MKNIILISGLMILLFSCRKNREEAGKINVNELTGNWTAAYLNKSIQINIDAQQNFSMSIPVMVKKESNAAPVVLNISLQGICVREDAGYELRIGKFSIAGVSNSSLEEIKELVYQSLEAAQLDLENVTENTQRSSARLTAGNGRLMIIH